MNLSDLHVHTTYCDGKSTVEEIVHKAEEMGMVSIGFSGHGYTDFDTSYCMSIDDTKNYINDIGKAKEKADIEVYLGIEKDILSDLDTSCFDYAIGSCHYVKKDGMYIEVDSSRSFEKNVNDIYGGDYLAFCKDYYRTICEYLPKAKADITGHIDLVTKFNEGGKFFSEEDKSYQSYALEAIDVAKEVCPIIEINTGAIARGYRKSPYPAKFILDYIRQKDIKIVINSDSHNKDTLCFYHDESIEILKQAGFKSHVVLKNGHFEEVGL